MVFSAYGVRGSREIQNSIHYSIAGSGGKAGLRINPKSTCCASESGLGRTSLVVRWFRPGVGQLTMLKPYNLSQ